MKQIAFWELKDFVGVDTKEERVPSVKRILESDARPVIHGRFGKFDNIQVSLIPVPYYPVI